MPVHFLQQIRCTDLLVQSTSWRNPPKFCHRICQLFPGENNKKTKGTSEKEAGLFMFLMFKNRTSTTKRPVQAVVSSSRAEVVVDNVPPAGHPSPPQPLCSPPILPLMPLPGRVRAIKPPGHVSSQGTLHCSFIIWTNWCMTFTGCFL